MQRIEINKGLHVGFEEIIKGIQQLDNSSLALFADEVNRLLNLRYNSSSKETELLKKIKTNIPPSVKRRQKQLYEKMQSNTISLVEKEELVLLNNMIEEKTAQRIILMGELAKLKRVSIQDLAKQL